MLLTTKNQVYDLRTTHGRAQSVAHSPYGAMLADTIETCLEESQEKLQDDADEMISKTLDELDPSVATDDTLDKQWSIFESELGARDRPVFAALLAVYRAERQQLVANADKLLNLVDNLRDLLGIEEEE